MDLTVLGACGTFAVPGGACSGYLVRHEGFSLWMDAGNGTLARLQEHIPLESVDAVFLSHLHPDHCVDLYPFLYALMFEGRDEPLPVYGPPNAREILGSILSEHSRMGLDRVFSWRGLSAGAGETIGPFRARVFDSAHGIENLTLRLEADGAALCYSGDTAVNDHLPDAARGAGLFLCEASWQDGQRAISVPIHMKASEAGMIAERAGVGRLVVTHVWPRFDLEVSREQAAAVCGAPVDVARTGDRWTL